jgi:hypothetical protein
MKLVGRFEVLSFQTYLAPIRPSLLTIRPRVDGSMTDQLQTHETHAKHGSPPELVRWERDWSARGANTIRE